MAWVVVLVSWSLTVVPGLAARTLPLSCVPHTHKLGSRCYVISSHLRGTWKMASQDCWNNYRAFPVALETEAETTEVLNYLRQHFDEIVADSGGLWIGAVLYPASSEWRWYPGKLKVSYANGTLGKSQGPHNAYLKTDSGGQWAVSAAVISRRYLCELAECPSGCANGGTCLPKVLLCQCPEPYIGRLCEIDSRQEVLMEVGPSRPPRRPVLRYNQPNRVEKVVMGHEITAPLFFYVVIGTIILLLAVIAVLATKIAWNYQKYKRIEIVTYSSTPEK